MIKIFGSLLMTIYCLQPIAQPTLEKLWETPPIIATPESALPDTKNGLLYISLIDGAPWEADGKGGIGILNMDGTIVDTAFITGLNAPKGMGLYKNKMYVADLKEVVVIDIKKKRVEKKIPIDGAERLNDITVSDKGVVYVSDSKTGKIHKLENEKPSLYASGLEGINGLKCIGETLYAFAGKNLLKLDEPNNRTPLATLTQGGDGLEPIGNGDFIASSWYGIVYYVHRNGKVDILLDTQEQKKNTADIGYDAANRIVYIPTFYANTIMAYKLK